MQSLFYLFCVVVVCVWLIGWGFPIAERTMQKNILKFNRWFKKMTKKLRSGFSVLIATLIVSGCTTTGPVEIRYACPPMLRTATYNAMQADELADYRIAVEQCKMGGIQ